MNRPLIALPLLAVLVAQSPLAQAGGYHHHHRHHNGAAAVAAGVLGLVVGTALASNSRSYYRDPSVTYVVPEPVVVERHRAPRVYYYDSYYDRPYYGHRYYRY